MNAGFGRNGTDWMAVMGELDRRRCRGEMADNKRYALLRLRRLEARLPLSERQRSCSA